MSGFVNLDDVANFPNGRFAPEAAFQNVRTLRPGLPSYIEVCKNLVINKCPSEACRLDDGIRLVSQAISPIA